MSVRSQWKAARRGSLALGQVRGQCRCQTAAGSPSGNISHLILTSLSAPLGPPTYHPPSFINGGITLPALSNAVDDNGDNRRETPIVQSTIIQPLRETKSQCEAGFYITLGHAIRSRLSSRLREASVRYK